MVVGGIGGGGGGGRIIRQAGCLGAFLAVIKFILEGLIGSMSTVSFQNTAYILCVVAPIWSL